LEGVNNYHRSLTDEEIDKRDYRTMVGGMWDEIGKLQFDFLKNKGLQPNHKLADIGCGSLRGGIHFIDYLDKGNYFGLDINESLLVGGKKEIQELNLGYKEPSLLQDNEFKVGLFGTTFDYALSVSLFTHLFQNHIIRCLSEIKKCMHVDSVYYATFFEAPSSVYLDPFKQFPGNKITFYDKDPFHYSFDEMYLMGKHAGLEAFYIGDWNHPRNQKMVGFRLLDV